MPVEETDMFTLWLLIFISLIVGIVLGLNFAQPFIDYFFRDLFVDPNLDNQIVILPAVVAPPPHDGSGDTGPPCEPRPSLALQKQGGGDS